MQDGKLHHDHAKETGNGKMLSGKRQTVRQRSRGNLPEDGRGNKLALAENQSRQQGPRLRHGLFPFRQEGRQKGLTTALPPQDRRRNRR